VCNCTKGGVTTLQHHSSENKNVPDHRTVTEYIILTNHVACMYSHIACLLWVQMYKRQRSPKAKSVQIAYCRLLQSWIYKNEPEQNSISLLLKVEIIDECPNPSKNISVRIKTYNAPNIRPAASNNAQRSAKYVQNILKTKTIKKWGPFVKHLKVTTTVNRFCHFVINKNPKMCPKRLFIYDKVNFRCRLLGTLQFVFLVV